MKFSNYEIQCIVLRVPDIFRCFSRISIDLIIFTGLLNGTLRESAKRARLELTQSGRLERIHTGILSLVHRARFHQPPPLLLLLLLSCGSHFSRVRVKLYRRSRLALLITNFIPHASRFFPFSPLHVPPHSCRGGTVLFYAIVNEKFLSTRIVSRIYTAPRFHKTHNFLHFLDSSAKQRRIRR